jgi:Methyltransferase domain
MHLKEILEHPPKVHRGGELTWGLREDVLRYIDENLPENASSIETGCGLSTVLLAAKGSEHICVVPDPEQVERVRRYCAAAGISLEKTTFELGRSEVVLPRLQRREFDLVLIDGGHGFPVPAIDWFYTAPLMKRGGTLIVDDTLLWTGQILKEFLQDEPEWEYVCSFANKAAVFKKLADGHDKEWNNQPYVVRKSRWLRRKGLAAGALTLLLRGEFGAFLDKVRNQRKLEEQMRRP